MHVFQNFNIKTVIIVTLLLLGPLPTEAKECHLHKNSSDFFYCDLCGCSTGSGSSGFGTLGNLSFVGLRYIYQDFESKDGIFNNSPTSTERFNTYQIWGRLPINDAISVTAILPYQDLKRKFTDRTESINGLGDISIIGWYQIKFYKRQIEDNDGSETEKEASGHKLNIGLGMKLPTGEFEERFTDRINPGFQVGTGSFDAIFSLMHTYSKNQLGLNTSATYYLKSANKNDYRFGNQFSYASNVYYNVPFEKSALSPFLGVSGDIYDSIEQFNETLPLTNGNIVNGTLGSEFMIDKFVLGANYTFPISQNLFGGNVTSKNRFTVYFNYVF